MKEMHTHENESLEFRQGYRHGLEKALQLSQEYINELIKDSKLKEACWVEVLMEDIDSEHSMYIVGDEE